MTQPNDGGPAFPFEYHNQTSRHQEGFYGSGDLAPGASQQFAGMSLRDWFAGQALAGIMANAKLVGVLAVSNQDPASCAYEMAEFMMAERDKR